MSFSRSPIASPCSTTAKCWRPEPRGRSRQTTVSARSISGWRTDMLDLDSVNAYYGDSHILHGVSLSVREGEVVCLLGRNGAGKTTTILTIMGYLKPRPGRIVFNGR